ncbi:MAG: hypothetical protein ACP5KU_07940, partial [Candidatus Bathyarchaeia archaeon]
FQVYLIVPVGGYTVSLSIKSQKEPTAQYMITVAILAAAFTTIKRKIKRKKPLKKTMSDLRRNEDHVFFLIKIKSAKVIF